MTHIANQRIKMGGKYYMPGDPISPSKGDLKDMPKGAVRAEGEKDQEPPAGELSQEQSGQLKALVGELTDADFKKDGEIRADSLKSLIEKLGFGVTAEQVAAAKDAGE